MRSLISPCVVLWTVLLSACQPPRGLDAVLAQGGVTWPQVRGFTVDPAAAAPVEPDTRSAVARRDGVVIRVRLRGGVAPQQAGPLIEEQWTMIRSVYEPQRPPYPEFLTTQAGCPPEFLPRERPHAAGRYWHLNASERLGYGVCSRDLARYSAGLVFLHCPAKRTVAQVEVFVPGWNQYARVDALAKGLTCQ